MADSLALTGPVDNEQQPNGVRALCVTCMGYGAVCPILKCWTETDCGCAYVDCPDCDGSNQHAESANAEESQPTSAAQESADTESGRRKTENTK